MKIRLFLSGIFLVIGIIIYYFFLNSILIKNNIVFSSIRNFIPDICWVLVFFFTSINFAYQFSKKPLLLNSIYIFIIAITFEFLQKWKFVKGTFDILDILFYCLAIILACIIEMKLRRNEYEKST